MAELNWPPRTPEEAARWERRDKARQRYADMMRARAVRQSHYRWQNVTTDPQPKSFTAPGPEFPTSRYARNYDVYKQLQLPGDWWKFYASPFQPDSRERAGEYSEPNWPLTVEGIRKAQKAARGLDPDLPGLTYDPPTYFANPSETARNLFTEVWQTDRFDAASWINAGATSTDLLHAAQSERLIRYFQLHGYEGVLEKMRTGVGFGPEQLHPSADRSIENLLQFYGKQFFTQRYETEDVEEHYKSIIARTDIGDFIERAIEQRLQHWEGLHSQYSGNISETLARIYSLKAQYANNEISYKQYSEGDKFSSGVNQAWLDVSRWRANQRFARSKYSEYQRFLNYPSGPQFQTKFARELGVGVTEWDEILRDRHLSRNQREAVHYLYHNKVADPNEYRRILNAIEGGLGDQLIPLKKTEQDLISKQLQINRVYNVLSLRAAGAINPEGEGVEAIFRNKGVYGLQGRITRLVDLNSWETIRGGTARELANAPLGSKRIGALVVPSEITSRNMLAQLGLRPGESLGDLPSSDILHAFRKYPANKIWYSGDNPQMADAADLVYGRISRDIRKMVAEASQKIGPISFAAPLAEDEKLYKSILGPDQVLDYKNIAQQLIAYYHVQPHMKVGGIENDEYANVLKSVILRANEGDQFATRIRDLLDTALPGAEAWLRPVINRNNVWSLQKGYRQNYFKAIDQAFRQSGTTRAGKPLFAQVSDTYERVTRPRAVNEVLQAADAGEGAQLGGIPAEAHLLETIGNDFSDEIEAAQQALELHDLDLHANFLEHELNNWTRADANLKRAYDVELRKAHSRLNELQDILAHQSPATKARVNEFLTAMSPLRAAEYYMHGLPPHTFPRVGGNVPKGVHPIEFGPDSQEEVKRLVGLMRGGAPLKDNWRLSYILSRYSKSAVLLGAENESARLSKSEATSDWLQRLRLTGINAAQRRGIEMGNAYREVARIVGERYNLPVMTDLIQQSIARGPEDESLISPFYARTIHDFRDNLVAHEGHNFDITEGPFQKLYEQLGGEDLLQLNLANVEPVSLSEGGGLYAANKTTHTVKHRVAARFELPAEVSHEEQVRMLGALQTPKFMEEWENNPAMREFTEHYKRTGNLSEGAVAQVMRRAQQMIQEADHQFHTILSFGAEDLTPSGPEFTADEYAELADHFYNILEASPGTHIEGEGLLKHEAVNVIDENTLIEESQRLAHIVANFGQRKSWGQIIVPVSNDENIGRLIPLDKLIPRVGRRNTVTENRFQQNLAAADHFFNWGTRAKQQVNFNEQRKLLNTAFTDFSSFPRVNGVKLSQKFFSDAIQELNEELTSQGVNIDMLKELSRELGGTGIWLGKEGTPDVEAAREVLGSDYIRSPLALGSQVDLGAETTRPLSDLWGHFLYSRSAPKSELIDMAQQLGVDLGPDLKKLKRSSIFKMMREQANFDISPSSVRKRMASHLARQADNLRSQEVMNVLDPDTASAVQAIFDRYQFRHEAVTSEPPPQPGAPGRTAADIGREAEEELRRTRAEAAKPGFTPLNMNELRRVWGNKGVRRGTMALGAFALWGLIRSHNAKEHTLAKMQGPQNQPGGNTPYTEELPPPNMTALPTNEYAQPNLNAPGYLYRIRATGNINPDKFQTQVMNITDSPISSGSIYDSRGMPNPDDDMYNTMNQYQ